jgi:hypothetical protein
VAGVGVGRVEAGRLPELGLCFIRPSRAAQHATESLPHLRRTGIGADRAAAGGLGVGVPVQEPQRLAKGREGGRAGRVEPERFPARALSPGVLFHVGQGPGKVHVGGRAGGVQADRFPAGIHGFGRPAAAPQDVAEAPVGTRQAGISEDGGAVGGLGVSVPVLPAQQVAFLGKLGGSPTGRCRGTEVFNPPLLDRG